MAFRIGMKVCCIDASKDPMSCGKGVLYDASRTLRKGAIYTIRAVGFHPNFPGELQVWLGEVVRPVFGKDQGKEVGFRSTRFRPVAEQKRETSISIFKEILDRENHGLPSRVDYPADCEPK